MKLSVIMMVQNEEQTIDLALKSVKPYASEIFVFDTGSSDSTIPILKQHNVILFTDFLPKIKFEGDKSWKHTAIRQFLLSRCKGDWILQLDGDEVYPKETMEEFMKRAQNEQAFRVEWINFIAPFKKVITPKKLAPMRFWKRELGLVYDRQFPYESLNYKKRPFHSKYVGKMIKQLENPLFHFSCLKKDYWRKKGKEFYLIGGDKTEDYKNDMINRYAKELGWSQ